MATISEIPKLESVEYTNVIFPRRQMNNITADSPEPEESHYDSVDDPIAKPTESFLEKYDTEFQFARIFLVNAISIAYFIWATIYFFNQGEMTSYFFYFPLKRFSM